MFERKRLCVAVDSTGDPLFKCDTHKMEFTRRDHVVCDECGGSSSRHTSDNVWKLPQQQKQLSSLMNQTLDTHRKPNDRCTCCVSCAEILSNPVFSKRISREFCGWGKVLDWKDTVVEQARDNMTTIHNHMWDSQIIQDALLPTSNNEGESEVGGNGRPKRKGKTPDGEREEVPDRSKKKKVKGKGSRRREKDDVDEGTDEHENTIPRNLVEMTLDFYQNIKDEEYSKIDNLSDIMIHLEKKTNVNPEELLGWSDEIRAIGNCVLRIKGVILTCVQNLYPHETATLSGMYAKIEKSLEDHPSEPFHTFQTEFRIHFKTWIIDVNKPLDDKFFEENKDGTEMRGFWKKNGTSSLAELFECTLVSKLSPRHNEFAVPCQVLWKDGDNSSVRKFRWQLKPSTESPGSVTNDTSISTCISNVMTDDSESLDNSNGVSQSQQQLATMNDGNDTSLHSSVSPGHDDECIDDEICVDSVLGEVRKRAIRTVRERVTTLTDIKVVKDKIQNIKQWDIPRLCVEIVTSTLDTDEFKQYTEDKYLGFYMNLECFLSEAVKFWLTEGLTNLLCDWTMKYFLTDEVLTQCQTRDEVLNKVKLELVQQVAASQGEDVFRCYQFDLQRVVLKRWQSRVILATCDQICSQVSVEDEGSSTQSRRLRQSDFRGGRFKNLQPLMLRLVGTDADRLLRLSREQIFTLGCCNHLELHKYLAGLVSGDTSSNVSSTSTWTCSGCRQEHPKVWKLCPTHPDILNPLTQSDVDRCFLVTDTRQIRKFMDHDPGGEKILQILGLSSEEYEVDHVIPSDDSQAGIGLTHVANLMIIHKDVNRFFSSNPERHKDKLMAAGSLVSLAARMLQTHLKNFWSSCRRGRRDRNAFKDLSNFRVCESKVLKFIDANVQLSPFVFALLPLESWLKVQCEEGFSELRASLEYVQTWEVHDCDRTTYSTKGGSNFVRTQDVKEIKSEVDHTVSIEIRPLTFSLWKAREVGRERYSGVEECYWPSGSICFPH